MQIANVTAPSVSRTERGMLVIWNDMESEWHAEFLRWHILEHVPERVGLPGFIRGQRYIGLDGSTPAYFNFYETETPSDLSSHAYKTRLNNPTNWTRSVVSHFQNTARTICRKVATAGLGDGSFVQTIRLSAAGDRATIGKAGGELIERIVNTTGVVAAHLLEGIPEASAGASAEKTLRKQADEIAAWVILIEAVDVEPLRAVARGAGSDAALHTAGFDGTVNRGLYRLEFALRHEFAQGHVPDPNRTWR